MRTRSLAAKLVFARKRERALTKSRKTVDAIVVVLGEDCREFIAEVERSHSYAIESAMAEHAADLERAWKVPYHLAYDVCLWLAMRQGCIPRMERRMTADDGRYIEG